MLRRMKSRHREIIPVWDIIHVERLLSNDPLGRGLHPPLVLLEPLGVAGQKVVVRQIVQNPSGPAVVDEFIGVTTGAICDRRAVKEFPNTEIPRPVAEIAVGWGAGPLQKAIQPFLRRIVQPHGVHRMNRSRRFECEIHVCEFAVLELRCSRPPGVHPARLGQRHSHGRILDLFVRWERRIGRQHGQLDLVDCFFPCGLTMFARQFADAPSLRG